MTAGGAIATRVPFMTTGRAIGTTFPVFAVVWLTAIIVPVRLSTSMVIAAIAAMVAVVVVVVASRRSSIGCSSSYESFGLLAAAEGTLTLIKHLDSLTEFGLVCPDGGHNVIVLVWESFNELLGETAVCKPLSSRKMHFPSCASGRIGRTGRKLKIMTEVTIAPTSGRRAPNPLV